VKCNLHLLVAVVRLAQARAVVQPVLVLEPGLAVVIILPLYIAMAERSKSVLALWVVWDQSVKCCYCCAGEQRCRARRWMHEGGLMFYFLGWKGVLVGTREVFSHSVPAFLHQAILGEVLVAPMQLLLRGRLRQGCPCVGDHLCCV
jgi:hypothetical protein